MELTALAEGVRLRDHALRGKAIPHAFGGAIAYGLYGIPRGTNDWDINVFCPESHAAEVFSALSSVGVESSEESYREVDRKGQVRLDWGGKKVDIFFAYSEFHEAVESRIREAQFEGTTIWVLSAEDILVFKVIFNRPHDWRDIERICHRMRGELDFAYVHHWLHQILGDDDSRSTRLRETVAAAEELMRGDG